MINQMIKFRIHKKAEHARWELYLVNYSKMTKDTYVPFEAIHFNQKIPAKRSANEILAEVENIRKAIRKEGE